MKLYQFDRIQYEINVIIIIANTIKQALNMLGAEEGLSVIDFNKEGEGLYSVRLGDGEMIELYDLTIRDLQEGLMMTIKE